MVLGCTSTTTDVIFQCKNSYSELARDIGEAANLATYFTGSAAAESTPHLYISSLATWTQDTELCRDWKNQFSRIPIFAHTKGRIDMPLMTIMDGEGISAVALSRDGRHIATASFDETVRVWDMCVLVGHTDWVNSVMYSRDGLRIVSGSDDKTVRVWDASTGTELSVLMGHTESVCSVAISRDDMRIAHLT